MVGVGLSVLLLISFVEIMNHKNRATENFSESKTFSIKSVKVSTETFGLWFFCWILPFPFPCVQSHGLGLYFAFFSQNFGGYSGEKNVLWNMRNIVSNRAKFNSFWAPEKNSRDMLLHRANFSYGEVEIFSRGVGVGVGHVPLTVPVLILPSQPPIQRLNSQNLFICRQFCHLPSSTYHIDTYTQLYVFCFMLSVLVSGI